MIGVMTKDEKRARGNLLRRVKRKKIKKEGGEAYEYHLKKQRENRERLKENKEAYESHLKKQRGYAKKYRSLNLEKYRKQQRLKRREWRKKLKEDPKKYKEFLEHRAATDYIKAKKTRHELVYNYIRQLLIEQGYKKNEISKNDINKKRLKMLKKRALGSHKKIIREREKELSKEITKEKRIFKEYLSKNNLKHCYRCNEIKLFNAFTPCRIKNKNYPSICKSCERIISKDKIQKRKNRREGVES